MGTNKRTDDEMNTDRVRIGNIDDLKLDTQDDVTTAWQALSEVIDPEVGLDIVTMGLVYSVEMWDDNVIRVDMTLTTPACPMGTHIQQSAVVAVQQACPDATVDVQLVWDPPWSPAMISPEGIEELRRS